MDIRRAKLRSMLGAMGPFALAFSGGTDSSFLLHEAVRAGADVRPYYVDSVFCRRSDLDRAVAFCFEMDVKLDVVTVDILSDPHVAANGPDRCYLCKRLIFSTIRDRASREGVTVIADGTNASDPEDSRPGMRAVREFGVQSPLRACGITKDDVRSFSRESGLSTWDMPSNSCIATRVTEGHPITAELLGRVDSAEAAVSELGFSGFRVRTDGDSACVRFTRSQRGEAVARADEVSEAVGRYFRDVTIDEEVRD